MLEHFNNNVPSSDCVKDEDAGIWYGNNGNSRDAFAARNCSDKGYFGRYNNSWDYQDCGGYRFRWNCQNARTEDWTPCFRDEESKKKGYQNRDDEANNTCKNKGYLGSKSV